MAEAERDDQHHQQEHPAVLFQRRSAPSWRREALEKRTAVQPGVGSPRGTFGSSSGFRTSAGMAVNFLEDPLTADLSRLQF